MSNKKDNFRQLLYTLVDTYGSELLDDTRRTNALLMDFAPGQTKERKLIISALDEGIGHELIKAKEKENQDQQLSINRCVQQLIDETWVTKEAALFAVNTIAYSVGIIIDETTNNSKATSVEDEIKELIKGTFTPGNSDYHRFLKQYHIIGYKAFASEQKLTNLELPNGIKTIKAKAFINCTNLKRIVIPASIEAIGISAFSGCDSLEQIEIDHNANYIVLNGMLIDKKNKALMRSTKSINKKCVIPHDVEYIQPYAFERSNVVEITLPRNLIRFDKNAFIFCDNLQRFIIDTRNQYYSSIDGVLHTKDKRNLIKFPTGYNGINYIIEDTVSHIAKGAFSGVAHIETVTFTSNLKSIGSNAFEYCRKISSLVLPSSVEIIGERAFQYCVHLSSIMLPRSIQEIGDYAFCGCSSIQTLSIPKSVKKIGHSAFKDCSLLKKIIIQDKVDFIGDGAFSGCSDNIEIAIKNNDYVEQYCSAHKIKWSAL